jgi:type IV pilus assembly protein PilX
MRSEPEVMRAQAKMNRTSRQSGAALVIGLLLLLVLTILAVSGMNSASLEFVMAGNEQYRANAFSAAESGIERTLDSGTFNPAILTQNLNGAATATDNWGTVTTTQIGGNALPALWGNSWNSFATYHFEIVSTGTSVRNATAINTQGVAIIAPWDPTVQNDPNLVDPTLH